MRNSQNYTIIDIVRKRRHIIYDFFTANYLKIPIRNKNMLQIKMNYFLFEALMTPV